MGRDARGFAACAAVLLALATIAGALAAHALPQRLPAARLATLQIAVHYQFFHALGLLGVAVLLDRLPAVALRIGAWLLACGIVLFSGSLYALASGLSGKAAAVIGALTPLGGLCLIGAWALIGFGVARGGRFRRPLGR